MSSNVAQIGRRFFIGQRIWDGSSHRFNSYDGWLPFGSVWNYLALLWTNICHRKLSHFFFPKMAQEGIFFLNHVQRTRINALRESPLSSLHCGLSHILLVSHNRKTELFSLISKRKIPNEQKITLLKPEIFDLMLSVHFFLRWNEQRLNDIKANPKKEKKHEHFCKVQMCFLTFTHKQAFSQIKTKTRTVFQSLRGQSPTHT